MMGVGVAFESYAGELHLDSSKDCMDSYSDYYLFFFFLRLFWPDLMETFLLMTWLVFVGSAVSVLCRATSFGRFTC